MKSLITQKINAARAAYESAVNAWNDYNKADDNDKDVRGFILNQYINACNNFKSATTLYVVKYPPELIKQTVADEELIGIYTGGFAAKYYQPETLESRLNYFREHVQEDEEQHEKEEAEEKLKEERWQTKRFTLTENKDKIYPRFVKALCEMTGEKPENIILDPFFDDSQDFNEAVWIAVYQDDKHDDAHLVGNICVNFQRLAYIFRMERTPFDKAWNIWIKSVVDTYNTRKESWKIKHDWINSEDYKRRQRQAEERRERYAEKSEKRREEARKEYYRHKEAQACACCRNCKFSCVMDLDGTAFDAADVCECIKKGDIRDWEYKCDAWKDKGI